MQPSPAPDPQPESYTVRSSLTIIRLRRSARWVGGGSPRSVRPRVYGGVWRIHSDQLAQTRELTPCVCRASDLSGHLLAWGEGSGKSGLFSDNAWHALPMSQYGLGERSSAISLC